MGTDGHTRLLKNHFKPTKKNVLKTVYRKAGKRTKTVVAKRDLTILDKCERESQAFPICKEAFPQSITLSYRDYNN